MPARTSLSSPTPDAPLRRSTLLLGLLLTFTVLPDRALSQSDDALLMQDTVRQYCLACHNDALSSGDLSLQSLDPSRLFEQGQTAEALLSKLRNRSMPPVEMPRPPESSYARLVSWLETGLDGAAAAAPNPGRTDTFHRLNRAEYGNAVRDLLALEIDVTDLLPADDIDAYGFDNMAEVLTVSPTLMERYLSAARRIARLALGDSATPVTDTYQVPILLDQGDRMSDALPFGSRGGTAVAHYFPVDGRYELRIKLHRNYVNYIRGLGSRHELEVRLDGQLLTRFFIGGEEPAVLQAPASYGGNQFGDAAWEEYMLFADANLQTDLEVSAGPHVLGVSFVRKFAEPEGVLQPPQSVFAAAVNEMRDGDAAVEFVEIAGPFDSRGPGDTPSRQAILRCQPAAADSGLACASEIISALGRQAYRRPLNPADLDTLLGFFQLGQERSGSFERGIQLALERILISPDFLFRVEQDPTDAGDTIYPLDDLALASRLSFFLWSSIPDEELLALAEAGRLQDETVLAQQVRRMLADPRADALVENFAGQWLYLRNLSSLVPDAVEFPEFDENLRAAFRQESELFFADLLQQDGSVLELIDSDFTFVNERLARHYGIEGVYGSHFRRVTLEGELLQQRGGIFGQGSLLIATSYANRTSPVLRGKWILSNVLGTPPPAPPPDVPDLPETGEGGVPATIRDRMLQHRENPVCKTCHAPMDPLGLALENYDAVGRWRLNGEAGLAIDASGQMPDGTEFYGLPGLRQLLLDKREEFAATLTEKLLAYAIGRPPEYFDKPVVRGITRAVALDNYRLSSIIVGIVQSPTFRTRRSKT